MLVLQSQWKAGTTEMGRDQTDWRRILDQVEEQHFLIPPGQNGGGGGRGSGESTQVHHLVWEAHDVQMHSRCCPGFGKCLLHGRAGLVRGGGSQF